jgi:hypothetical protein
MRERFVILPLASVTGTTFEDYQAAENAAGKRVEIDGRPHVIVKVVGEVRRRSEPNVDVVRFDREAANG